MDVPDQNEGTLRLHRDWAHERPERLDRGRAKSKTPAAVAKLSAALKGRVQSPATVEAVRAAAKRPRSEEWKRKIFWDNAVALYGQKLARLEAGRAPAGAA